MQNSRSGVNSTAITVGLIIVALIVAAILVNFLSSRSTEVFVANYTPDAATLSWDGVEKILASNSWEKVELPEDITRFNVKTSHGGERTINWNPDSIMGGTSGDLIFNIGGAGVFIQEEIVYAEDTSLWREIDTDWSIITGKEWNVITDCDYVLEESPDEININTLEDFRLITQLSPLDFPPQENARLLYDWLAYDESEVIFDYVEAQMLSGYNDPNFTVFYWDLATEYDYIERANSFLESNNIFVGEYIEYDVEESELYGVPVLNSASQLSQVADLDSIIIKQREIQVHIGFPLETSRQIALEAPTERGFTKGELYEKLAERFIQLYEEEEATATIPAEVYTDDIGRTMRSKTNGIHGISDAPLEYIRITMVEQVLQNDTLVVIPYIVW